MKKLSLLAAAAAVVCATPAMAQDHGGYIGLRYSSGELDSGVSTDIASWQGEGELGWNTGSWGGQFGASFGNTDTETADSNFTTLNGHINWGSDTWRIGGYVVYGTIDDVNVDEWTYGVEGSFNLGANTTLIASGSLGTLDGPVDTDTWNVDVSLAYYFSDNVRVSGIVGVGNLENFDYDTTSYGINAEFQPFAAPVSFTLGWNAISVDGSSFNGDGDYFSVGARWNFGGGTLRERNSATPFNQPTGYAQRVYGATIY